MTLISLRFFSSSRALALALALAPLALASGPLGCSSDPEPGGTGGGGGQVDPSGAGGAGGQGGEGGQRDASSSGGAGGQGGAASSSSAGGGGAGGSGGAGGGGEPTSSHGEGGIPCDKEGDLDVEEGAPARKYCQAREGSVDFRFVTPSAPTGPLRLALYLHGDGAGAYKSNSAAEVLLPWIDAHDAIMISALAPNGCAWWLKPDYACPSDPSTPVDEAADRDHDHQNATALAAVLERFRASYDVVDGPVFYYGSSGGSVFLTSSFIPKYGDKYPGAFAINCGGEVPGASAIAWDFGDAAKRGATAMWFTYGDQDFLYADEQASVSYFDGQGFSVHEQVLAGKGHCEFDGHGRAREVWNEYLGE